MIGETPRKENPRILLECNHRNKPSRMKTDVSWKKTLNTIVCGKFTRKF
jgi:hypothetical protein